MTASQLAYRANDTGRVAEVYWNHKKEFLKEVAQAKQVSRPKCGPQTVHIPSGDARVVVESLGVIAAVIADNQPVSASQKSTPLKSIPLHSLLEGGALLIAAISLASLISWLVGGSPLVIVNPFIALLSLIMSPFFYLMGRAARK